MRDPSRREFDYVIVGGGTAGAVIAARLSEDPALEVALIEAGPDDRGLDEVLQIKRWLELLEGPLDYGYTTQIQPRGNSHIVHSRARVLGGCSSHNTMIWFKPLPGDWDDWVACGADGWGGAQMEQWYDRLENRHQIIPERDRDPILPDWIDSAVAATGVQREPDWNAAPFRDGAGFLDVAYDPDTGVRSSSSVAYLHPIMDRRPNLHVICDTRCLRIDAEGGRARTACCIGSEGPVDFDAREEIILCAGAIDSPRLLLLSGIGPADELRTLGIEVQHDLPGVGQEILDHPESIIMWELERPLGPQTAMGADCALFVNRLGADDRPDLMFHTYQLPFTVNTERLGYPVPDERHVICMTPNVPRTRSRGRLWLLSRDPDVRPAIDFGYFTDPEGYDEQTIVDGLEIARDVASTGPFAKWIRREIAPGEGIVDRAALSAYGRAAHHTVYHPLGGCRIGATDDATAVVGPDLRVRGLDGLRVADGAIFPALTTVNPVVAILMIGEKCADLILRDRTSQPAPG